MAYDGMSWAGRGLACDGRYSPAMDFTPTSGGGLPVTSASAVAPTGISVVSENVYEGILSAAGELPFVGTTAMEGVLPTAGAGAINHACGNGINAMAAETTAFVPAAAAIAPAAVGMAPAVSAISPAAATLTPAAPFAAGAGYGLGNGYVMGNRFGLGCGARGIY
ncbi:chorion class B protein Ld32-like [Anticarsia gemmatalis]|uniref:chorion class B protein Ld32-like n=1 Tax=Anticarsia gemmatalis TaxID=129554 RepID=UPI003F774CD2